MTGLTRTQAWSQPGIVSTGTNVDEPNVSGKISRNASPWTAPALRATSPTRTKIHETDIENPTSSRHAAAVRSQPPVGWNPMARPTVMSTPIESVNRTTSPRTAPTSGAERAMGRLRNRSKTPLPMSALRFTPIAVATNRPFCTMRAGSTNCR